MSASRARTRRSTGPTGPSGGELGPDAEHYRLLIDTLPVFIWTSRPDGGLEFRNRPLLEYAQRSLAEVVGELWQEFVHPDDLQRVLEARARTLRTGESSEAECRLRRGADGSHLWFLVRSEPMRDAAGEITRWCGTAANIERRKCSEKALESLAALLRHSQRSAHVGSYLVEWPDATDRSTYRLQWSDEFYRIFGYDPGAVEPSLRAWTRRIHPDERQRVIPAFEEAIQHRRGLELEYHIVRVNVFPSLNGGDFRLPEADVPARDEEIDRRVDVPVMPSTTAATAPVPYYEALSTLWAAACAARGGDLRGESLVNLDVLGPMSRGFGVKLGSKLRPAGIEHGLGQAGSGQSAGIDVADAEAPVLAHDGRRALEIAAILHPDIALLDVGMPELNGYELARRIRSHPWGRHMKRVAVTGWGQDEHRRQALAAGFDEHLTKPIDPQRLIGVIEPPPTRSE